jgi:hypothetical protein
MQLFTLPFLQILCSRLAIVLLSMNRTHWRTGMLTTNPRSFDYSPFMLHPNTMCSVLVWVSLTLIHGAEIDADLSLVSLC